MTEDIHTYDPQVEADQASEDDPAVGRVDKATKKQISGWVWPQDDRYPEVQLTVNGLPIAKTRALQREQDSHGRDRDRFFFTLKSLEYYLNRQDEVGVTSKAGALAMPAVTAIGRRGKKSSSKLHELIANGHVFNKKGGLQLSKLQNEPWQDAVFETYEALREVFRSEFEYDLFPCYGTLLGAVRNGTFIGHDDDFDCAYISRYTDPVALRREIIGLGHRLIAHGFRVKAGITCLKVGLANDDPVLVDIFHSFFDVDDVFKIPFGTAGVVPYTRADYSGSTTAMIGERQIVVPADPEKLLAWIYGPNWKIPDPTFNWGRSANIRLTDAFPTIPDRQAIYWDNRHRWGGEAEPSTAPTILAPLLPVVGTVCDLGCGLGADALAMAEAHPDLRVLACDRSGAAITRARKAAAASGNLDPSAFAALDLSVEEDVEGYLRDVTVLAGSKPILFVARRLFDLADTRTVRAVSRQLIAISRPGDLLFVEERKFGAKWKGKIPGRPKRSVEKLLAHFSAGEATSVLYDDTFGKGDPGWKTREDRRIDSVRRLVLQF